MEITSKASYARISPKKMKGLSAAVVGLAPQDAVNRLLLQGGKRETLLSKVIKGAIANASNNYKLDAGMLTIATIMVSKGPFFKRFQPVSRGMAHPYKKRTSHITVVLRNVEPKVEKVENEVKVEKTEVKNVKKSV